MARVGKEDLAKLPPPPPLTGANTQVILAQPTYPANRDRQEGVHQDNNNNNNGGNADIGRNHYEEQDQTYVVFVTEPTDRQSLNRRNMEVNAVMPTVPQYMYWPDLL
jgi:hypothetical protein